MPLCDELIAALQQGSNYETELREAEKRQAAG